MHVEKQKTGHASSCLRQGVTCQVSKLKDVSQAAKTREHSKKQALADPAAGALARTHNRPELCRNVQERHGTGVIGAITGLVARTRGFRPGRALASNTVNTQTHRGHQGEYKYTTESPLALFSSSPSSWQVVRRTHRPTSRFFLPTRVALRSAELRSEVL